MTDERDLVPFESTPLFGERTLVLAPHPDDEAIGCGGLIALHRQENRDVRVLVVTDGGESEKQGDDSVDLRERREAESTRGLEVLGASPPRFLRFADRSLSKSTELAAALRAEIEERAPDLILVPNPLEIHPDHVALCRALVALIHEDQFRSLLSTTRIAFYETSQTVRPNTLVDISSVANLKREAIECHESQSAVRDYARFADGLGQYRTLTLDGATHAEAFWVISAEELRLMSWLTLCAAIAPKDPIKVAGETLPVTVVIRTRDRLTWLREAVESVLANDHPAEIVVVNDGGESPEELLATLSKDIHLVEHSSSEGRSEAMNAGVRAADTEWIAFLDDDDLYYGDHISTLANAAQTGIASAVYSDAVSAFYEIDETGSYRVAKKLRTYAQDFDADLLLLDNYVPLPTLLVRRDDFLSVGGFDRRFDLFEDWDFLIRLSSDARFVRVPRVTCEIRHLPASGSAIMGAPAGSSAFRQAKLKIWDKHRDRLTDDVLANVFEAQRRRLDELFGSGLDASGRARHLETDVIRLEREKTLLIEEIKREHDNYAAASTEKGRLEHELSHIRDHFEIESAARLQAETDLRARDGEVTSLQELLEEHRSAVESQTETIKSLFAEIENLNRVISVMRSSKVWKLHEFAERIKGR